MQHPLITAKPYPARAAPAGDAVGSPLPHLRYGPVTTELERARPQALSHPIVMMRGWQIYGWGNTRALMMLPCTSRRTSPGYVDGEGCFTVSISPRPTLLVGWEVRPSLSVSQNGDRIEVLLAIQEYFGCGTLRPDRSDRTVKWEVRSLQVLVQRIVPHFHTYPLLSGKRKDFELFADICGRMTRGDHRLPMGLSEIVQRAGQMNPSGKRSYLPEMVIAKLSEMKA